MVEQLNTFEKHNKLKTTASNETQINSLITKELDEALSKFNFDESREFSTARKKTSRRSEVESLLKYSIELEKERNNTSNESTPKVEKRDIMLRNTLDNKDVIQDVLDGDIKIISVHKCEERASNFNFLEEDYEDNFITINPSGSVLAPSPNPYNKLDKIAEANLELTRNPPIKYSPTKVTFNDNITMLETSEDSESDDDSDENESTTSVDSKLVSGSDDRTVQSPENNAPTIEEKSVEPINCISFVVDESFIESDDDVADNNLDDTNLNKSILLVKVPNTAIELLKGCADVSSESENEDVCVGNTNEKGCTSITIDDYSCLQNRHENSFGDKSLADQNSKVTTQAEEITSSEKNTSIITENSRQQGNISSYNEEYLKMGETEAGITIKITCPDGTDFSKTNSIVSNNDEIFEKLTENRNSNSSPTNDRKQISESVRAETKKKLSNVKSAVKLKEPENNNNNNNNNSFSTRVRKRSVMHKKFLIKDVGGDNNVLNRRRKEGKNDNMNDSELLAEKIFKSLCHNNRSNGSTSQLENEKTIHEASSNKVLKQRNGSLRKSAVLKLHSKSMDSLEKRKKSNVEVCFCNHAEKQRPKSSVDRRKSESAVERPVTAPAPTQRRCCAVWGQGRLPDYNGLHSEYGLSAEQLQERKREKIERNKARKQMREEKRAEEERKRKENEERFSAWLEKKREQEKIKMIHTHLYYYQPNRLQLKNFCAPSAHLIKIGAYRKKQSRNLGCKNFSVDKFLTNITPQEKRTYRIYLGLSPN